MSKNLPKLTFYLFFSSSFLFLRYASFLCNLPLPLSPFLTEANSDATFPMKTFKLIKANCVDFSQKSLLLLLIQDSFSFTFYVLYFSIAGEHLQCSVDKWFIQKVLTYIN